VKEEIGASGFAILGLTPQALLCRPDGAFGADSWAEKAG
jgi:hypothetical protein